VFEEAFRADRFRTTSAKQRSQDGHQVRVRLEKISFCVEILTS
jgi:hypothetical protein